MCDEFPISLLTVLSFPVLTI